MGAWTVTLGVVVALIGCGGGGGSGGSSGNGGSGGSGGATGGPMTVQGQLMDGTVTGGALIPLAPLQGYSFVCVTLGVPPISGNGMSAADGQFTFRWSAVNIPFSCYITDPSGRTVGTVVFRNGTLRAQSVQFTGDATLGGVVVDSARGLAEATVQAGATLSKGRPPGADCELGGWQIDTRIPSCDPGMTIKQVVWVLKKPTGEHYVFQTSGPIMTQGDNPVCAYSSSSLPATFANGTVHFEYVSSTTCGGRTYGSNLTPASNCTSAVWTGTESACQACPTGSAGDCGACGAMTCMVTGTATRP